MVYVWHGQLLSKHRTGAAAEDLSAIPVSADTVAAAAAETAGGLGEFTDLPRDHIAVVVVVVVVVDFDEAGFRAALGVEG